MKIAITTLAAAIALSLPALGQTSSGTGASGSGTSGTTSGSGSSTTGSSLSGTTSGSGLQGSPDQMFQRLDTNSDGSISREEFSRISSMMGSGSTGTGTGTSGSGTGSSGTGTSPTFATRGLNGWSRLVYTRAERFPGQLGLPHMAPDILHGADLGRWLLRQG